MKLTKFFFGVLLFSILFSLASCSSDSSSSDDGGNSGKIMIDASNSETWVYYNVHDMKVVEVADPQNSLDWDIAFKRYQVKTNSGTSGSGNAGVLNLYDANYDEVLKAPKGYYCQDDSISITMVTEEHYSYNKEFYDWYNMAGGMPPQMSSKGYTYVVRQADGQNYFKLKFESYYNPETEDSGFLTMDIAPLAETSEEMIMDIKKAEIDATSQASWVYFSFEKGEEVMVENPEESQDWDIAFNRYRVKTNSGTSGNLGFGALLIGDTDDGAEFKKIREFDGNEEFTADEDMIDYSGNPFSGNPVLYYMADMSSMPPPADSTRIYAVQTAKFNYVKLQFTYYKSGEIKFRYEKNLTAKW